MEGVAEAASDATAEDGGSVAATIPSGPEAADPTGEAGSNGAFAATAEEPGATGVPAFEIADLALPNGNAALMAQNRLERASTAPTSMAANANLKTSCKTSPFCTGACVKRFFHAWGVCCLSLCSRVLWHSDANK